jgi:xylulose-5-phosphate/fructose-6-phosphate phosphoketolase
MHQGLGIWDWASNDQGYDPDLIMASCACNDLPTLGALAATALLREFLPDLKIRFVNVVDLFKLISEVDNPHRLSDREYTSLFTVDRP